MTNQKYSKGKIIIFGIMFWYPLAGTTYQFLHHVTGLRRLRRPSGKIPVAPNALTSGYGPLGKLKQHWGKAYTTIANWSNSDKDIIYPSDTYYWRKDREFKKFLDLPRLHPLQFEIATSMSEKMHHLLRKHGWANVNRVDVSKDIDFLADRGHA